MLKQGIKNVAEFASFIRLPVALLSVSLSISGALLMGFSPILIPIGVCSFCTCATGYAYNRITDIKEDQENGEVNRFASGELGRNILILLLSAGLVSSFFLPFRFTFMYILLSAVGIVYSHFRIKAVPVVKNVYTAVLLSAMLLFGAGFVLSETLVMLTAIAFAMSLAATIIADMRDIEGDTRAGVVTLANMAGLDNSKIIASFVLLGGVLLSLMVMPFAIQVLPSSFLAFVFLLIDKTKLSHFSVLSSLILFAFFAGV